MARRRNRRRDNEGPAGPLLFHTATPFVTATDDEHEGSSTGGPRTPTDVDIEPGGRRLGEILIQRQAVDRDQLTQAILQQHDSDRRLGSLLIESGMVSEQDLVAAVADQAGVETIELGEIHIERAAVEQLSESLARSLKAVPVRRRPDGSVEVAAADPRPQVERRLTEALAAPVTLFAASPSAIQHVLDSSYRALEGVTNHIQRFEQADAARQVDDTAPNLEEDDAPVISVVNLLLTQALRDRASDIHIEPQDVRVRIRYRIDGALHDVLTLPGNMASAVVSRIKILAGLNIVERRRPQDGQISTTIEDRDLDIRVAISPTIWGEKVVLRLLDKSKPLFRLSELGMSDEAAKTYTDLIHSPFGMVVCAGPTGSGKTTTLYASLLELNDLERNITTIEDPVEYVLPSINQIQISPSTELTFTSGLRSILRQDPDVILVGEIRDDDTARIAVRAALTGHLVLSTIHATDAPSALQRFLEMDVESFLLSSSILAVVAQRLMRRICSECRVAYTPDATERAFFLSGGGDPSISFEKGAGCNFCAQTGYHDRVGVYEVLTITDELRDLIISGGSREVIRSTAIQHGGMRTLRQEGIRLVEEGLTTINEVMRTIWTME